MMIGILSGPAESRCHGHVSPNPEKLASLHWIIYSQCPFTVAQFEWSNRLVNSDLHVSS